MGPYRSMLNAVGIISETIVVLEVLEVLEDRTIQQELFDDD